MQQTIKTKPEKKEHNKRPACSFAAELFLGGTKTTEILRDQQNDEDSAHTVETIALKNLAKISTPQFVPGTKEGVVFSLSRCPIEIEKKRYTSIHC